MKYNVTFHDFWNTTSGLSGGARADILCQRDAGGFPYVPGKTLKGFVREAACIIHEYSQGRLVSDAFITDVLGISDNTTEDLQGKNGIAYFGDAILSQATRAAIKSEDLLPHLFTEIAATAIEADGIAKSSSLRRAEFVLPCMLEGVVLDLPEEFTEPLRACFCYIKRMGYNRNRGYGRCNITLL